MITIPGTKTKVPVWGVVGVGAAAIVALLLSRNKSAADTATVESTSEDTSGDAGGFNEALANALESLDQRVVELEDSGALPASSSSAPAGPDIPLEYPDQSDAWENPLVESAPLITQQIGPNLSVRPELVASLMNVTTGEPTKVSAAAPSAPATRSEPARTVQEIPVSTPALSYAGAYSRSLTPPDQPSLTISKDFAQSVKDIGKTPVLSYIEIARSGGK